MGISVLGLLLDDLNFILVAKFPRLFLGGYWFLVVGAAIDGCLGGNVLQVSSTTSIQPPSRLRDWSCCHPYLFDRHNH